MQYTGLASHIGTKQTGLSIMKTVMNIKIVKIEVILLKVQLLQHVFSLLFYLHFAHHFVHYLRINLPDKMSLLLYWVTFRNFRKLSNWYII